MMTKIKTPKLAKIKVLLLAPLTAGLLMAFSNPDPIVNPVVEKVEALSQHFSEGEILPTGNNLINKLLIGEQSIIIKGKIVDNESFEPISGVTVLIKGTKKGTFSDDKGNFQIRTNTSNATLEFSHISYISLSKEFKSNSDINIQLSKVGDILNPIIVSYVGERQNPEIKPEPIILIDGALSDLETLNKLKSEKIEAISVLKGEKAISKYGSKGENGVILITTKKNTSMNGKTEENQASDSNPIFTAVEQKPSFHGGSIGLNKFLSENLVVPTEGVKQGLSGTVYASFIVNETGAISNVKIIQGLGQSYDEEVLRVIGKMPNWEPGQQNGKAVSVRYIMPVKFEKNTN